MTRAFILLSCLAPMLLIASCESTAGTAAVCEAGAYQECPCAGDGAGVQQCKEDGSSWGLCSCDPGTSPDAGSSDAGSSDADGGTPSQDAGPEEVSPADTAVVCQPQFEKVCNGDLVVWVDSCGMLGDTIQNCAEVGYCSAGACVEACLPKQEERCSGDTIYWFDSCGAKESVSVACEDDEFCVGCHEDDDLCSKDAQCVKGFFDGTWKITADPNTKDACGMGNSTYFDLNVELVVHEDGTVEATGDVLDYDLHYVGQLTGKNLEMSASYSQTTLNMTIDHTEVIDVDFVSLERFEGLSADTFVMPLLGECTLYWDITGVKQ